MSAEKQDKESGIDFTIIRGGEIYNVHPDGHELVVSVFQGGEVIAFELLSITKK